MKSQDGNKEATNEGNVPHHAKRDRERSDECFGGPANAPTRRLPTQSPETCARSGRHSILYDDEHMLRGMHYRGDKNEGHKPGVMRGVISHPPQASPGAPDGCGLA